MSETFSTSVTKQNKKYRTYLEEELVPNFGTLSAANMETIRFYMEQHKEPLADKIDELIERIKELEKKLRYCW